MEERIDTKNLYLAELKRCDKDKGVELMDPLSYVFVFQQNDSFYNVFTKEEYPTYGRVPYSNNTTTGEAYGTKVKLLNNVDVSGPCYLLTNIKCEDLFDEDSVDLKEIEDYILNSSYFFKDRVDIAIKRLIDFKHPFKMIGIIKRENSQKEEINAYLGENTINKQKVKKWK